MRPTPIFGPESRQPSPGFVWGSRFIEVTPDIWEGPDAVSLLVAVRFGCPKCGYPLYVKAHPQVCEITSSGLTLRQKVTCPGHWASRDENGHFTTTTNGGLVHERCGWTGSILRGQGHHPRCSVFHDSDCDCSCNLE